MSPHLRLITALAFAALLLAAPTASADLRATPLESSCSNGYSYGEHTYVNWTVEGCFKEANELAGETRRRVYRGNIEVNGMIFEIPDAGPDLTATVKDNGDTGRLARTTSTTIVFDPLVGGARKRFVMYTGAIDLETEAQDGGGGNENPAQIEEHQFGNLVFAKPAAAAKRAEVRSAAVVGIGTDYVDIPTSGSPKIFGLTLRGGLQDAAIRPQNGSIAATTEVDVELALSSTGASDLLDVNANETIKLTDGEGMETTRLRLNFPDIEVPGIGGLEDFYVRYRSGDDVWRGGLTLDLGSLFPEIEFEAEVSASDGRILYIRTDASDLPPIPIGATGIVLDSVRFEFGLDPLLIAAGADATAGPQIAGNALVLLSGDVRMEFEPNFRLEVDGGARVLPSSGGELASGTFGFVYDADGVIAVDGNARFEATVLDIGIGAQISGSGAYSTTRNRFNIEASASGELILGFLGDFEVARFEAVVSSEGFGTCGRLLGFLSGGIGQEWGRNLKVFTGCDLTDFDAPIRGARVYAAQGGARARRFVVPRGAKQFAVEVTTDQPGPRVRLRAPNGSERVTTSAGQRQQVDADTVVVVKPDASRQVIALRNPPAGQWTVEWLPEGPQVTGIRTARDVPPIKARVQVRDRGGDRAGRRRISIRRTSRMEPGERVLYAIRTPKGLHELGAPTAAVGGDFNYDIPDAVSYEVVAMRVRDGIPIPGSKTVVGRFRDRLPQRPRSISKRRRGDRLTVEARTRRGSEAPDQWQYLFDAGGGRRVVHRARPGRPITIGVPRRIRNVRVTARPVVQGRALR
jgi:hypothetical protein